MSRAQTIGGRGAPSIGGANGLPSALAGKRLIPLAGGSLAGYQAGTDALGIEAQLSALGTVLLPGESIMAGIRRAVSQKGALGARLLVPEGVWDVGANGVTVNASGLEIIALSPGRTVFRRSLGSSADTLFTTGAYSVKYGALTLGGDNITVRGVTFLDATGSAPAILATGDGVSVRDCVFQDCDRAVIGYQSNGLRVQDNVFTAVRAAASVLTLGTMSRAVVSGNRGDGNIVLVSGTTYSSVAGNVLDSSHRITFVGGSAANTASGNSAPVNEEGSYTLADNTAAATDVPSFPTWDVTIYRSVRMVYQITRGATPDAEAGELQIVMNSAECDAYVDGVATATSCGVALIGAVSAGVARLQYTTTATGNAATLRVLSVSYGGA